MPNFQQTQVGITIAFKWKKLTTGQGMIFKNKADKLRIFNFSNPEMRVFHMTWFSFFLCFFGWFGIAPLMMVIKEEFQLTKSQIATIAMGSVAMTIIGRIAIGWICERFGPRLSYTWLLLLGSIPVMGIGLANSYESFLICRLLIGIIGASFVITQYHTSIVFAPNCVGTASATSAGWGNLGGGVAQLVIPVIYGFIFWLTADSSNAWRLSMIFPGVLMIFMGIAYFFYTKDCLDGNFKDLKNTAEKESPNWDIFIEALMDIRVWALCLIYGACFGIELTMYNFLTLYYGETFQLDLKSAGLIAALFGIMNIFARTLGGYYGDKMGMRYGLRGRVFLLMICMAAGGISLIIFSLMNILILSIVMLTVFSIFTKMSAGATYNVVPFINKKALGPIAGIVGAGGNAGAVLAAFLFRHEHVSYGNVFCLLGVIFFACSFLCLFIRFSKDEEKEIHLDMEAYRIKNLTLDKII